MYFIRHDLEMVVVVKDPVHAATEKRKFFCIRSLFFNQLRLTKEGKAVLAFLNGEQLF